MGKGLVGRGGRGPRSWVPTHPKKATSVQTGPIHGDGQTNDESQPVPKTDNGVAHKHGTPFMLGHGIGWDWLWERIGLGREDTYLNLCPNFGSRVLKLKLL